jgi:putative ABC transport system permease protein
MTGVVSSGRLPVADDELAIGSRTARELGVGIGDEIVAPGPDGPVTYRVVGIGVLPPRLDSTSGTGAWGTVGGVLAAGEVDIIDGLDSQTLLRFEDAADGTRREQTIQALEQRYPALSFGTDQMAMTPERLGQMDRIRTLLLVLVGFVGLIGAIGVMHYLVLSVGRRRSETAVLRAIGFVRGQARAVVTWQAVVVAVIGSLIGVPVGFLIGRLAWQAILADAGVIADVSPSLLVLLGVPAVVILGAVALAAMPAWLSVRRCPAAGIREQ